MPAARRVARAKTVVVRRVDRKAANGPGYGAGAGGRDAKDIGLRPLRPVGALVVRAPIDRNARVRVRAVHKAVQRGRARRDIGRRPSLNQPGAEHFHLGKLENVVTTRRQPADQLHVASVSSGTLKIHGNDHGAAHDVARVDHPAGQHFVVVEDRAVVVRQHLDVVIRQAMDAAVAVPQAHAVNGANAFEVDLQPGVGVAAGRMGDLREFRRARAVHDLPGTAAAAPGRGHRGRLAARQVLGIDKDLREVDRTLRVNPRIGHSDRPADRARRHVVHLVFARADMHDIAVDGVSRGVRSLVHRDRTAVDAVDEPAAALDSHRIDGDQRTEVRLPPGVHRVVDGVPALVPGGLVHGVGCCPTAAVLVRCGRAAAEGGILQVGLPGENTTRQQDEAEHICGKRHTVDTFHGVFSRSSRKQHMSRHPLRSEAGPSAAQAVDVGSRY